jgi:protein TonB
MPALKKPAADLRSKYSRCLKISFILSLSFLILAFQYSPYPSDPEIILVNHEPPIKVTEIPETVQKPKPPPLPDVPKPIDPNQEDFEEFEFDETEWYETDDVKDPPPPPPPPEIPKETVIFRWSEVMPEPVGGLAAIQNNVAYTEIAKRIGLEGTVFIEAIVDENGNVIESKVIKKIGGGLDEEALNAVAITKFHPGLQRGKPVKVRITIPIKFVLN